MNLSQGPQRRQRQAMVTAKGDNLGPALTQRAHGVRSAEVLERLRHLLCRDVVVKGRDGDVAAVDNLGPVLVRVDVGAGIEGAQ